MKDDKIYLPADIYDDMVKDIQTGINKELVEEIRKWMKENPDHPDVIRFNKLRGNPAE